MAAVKTWVPVPPASPVVSVSRKQKSSTSSPPSSERAFGPVEPADGQHLGPTPGDAVGVLDRLEAARRHSSRGLEVGACDHPAGKRI